MPEIQIPDPLPPAIAPPREVIELAISQHLQEFGTSGLVARTWRWILHGGGPGPISHMDWSPFDGNGPPTAATIAAESTAGQPLLLARTPWAELNQARFICWWCTASPEDAVPLRFHPWDAVPNPTSTENASATVTVREIRNGNWGYCPSYRDIGTGPTLTARSNAAMSLGTEERRLLAQMPLHAITSVHGEPGLRERLLIEIADFSPADRDRVQRALALASRLHAADQRQREPYLNHLLRVAIRVISHYRAADPDLACAALLHDAVEDHASDLAPGGGQQEALAVLAAQFGDRVSGLVAAVTNPAWLPGQDADEQYRDHVGASLLASPEARVIKASDFTDNAVGLIHTTGPKLRRLAGKYAPLVPVLRDLINRPDTPLDAEVKEHITRQLDGAARRFALIGPKPEPR
jgi:HD domain